MQKKLANRRKLARGSNSIAECWLRRTHARTAIDSQNRYAGWVYLAEVLDSFSRAVVGWSLKHESFADLEAARRSEFDDIEMYYNSKPRHPGTSGISQTPAAIRSSWTITVC